MTSQTLERHPEQHSSAREREMSYEEANVLELKNVLSEFVAGRAGKAENEATPEDMQRGLEDMWHHYELLENLGEEKAETATVPAFTVAIPVAVLRESPETMANTIELIRRSHDATDAPAEVVVWANANYTPDTKYGVETSAKEKYNELVKTLEPLNGNGIVIRTALQTLPQEEAGMSNIRSNYMDAISIEGVEKGYGYDHPVVWLDADTTFIAKGALKEVTEPVRRFDTYVAHTNQHFTTEWANGTPLSDMDDATKAVAVNEIVRRRARRGGGTSYFEESGLALTLGVYLKAGGVDTSDAINESPRLSIKVREAYEREMLKVMNMRALTPKSLWKKGQKIPRPLTQMIKSARTGLSGRRQYERIKQSGVGALEKVDTKEYTLYSHMNTLSQASDTPVDADEMYDMLDRNRLTNDPFKGIPSQEFARRVVERYFSRRS